MLVEAGADTHARNADGRTAAELAAQPAIAGLLAQEEAWLAVESAPRTCYVLFAGVRTRLRLAALPPAAQHATRKCARV